MKKRFTREDIDRHIANCDGAGFPTNSTIGVMTQLRDDRDKLVKFVSGINLQIDGLYCTREQLEDLGDAIENVLKEVE